jgi:hypothetical protein
LPAESCAITPVGTDRTITVCAAPCKVVASVAVTQYQRPVERVGGGVSAPMRIDIVLGLPRPR